ncbi:MAG: four helix bundle protein [Patescibacteria group bacterium]
MIHRKIPRTERFGLGNRIDNAFLDLLTVLRRASFTEPKQKIPLLEIAVVKIDDIRFFIQLLWENKLISQEQFISFGTEIYTIGKNIGGWRKEIVKKTSQH